MTKKLLSNEKNQKERNFNSWNTRKNLKRTFKISSWYKLFVWRLIDYQKLLNEWIDVLDAKSEAERRSSQGKLASATFKQCRNNIEPFFDLLKNRVTGFYIFQ